MGGVVAIVSLAATAYSSDKQRKAERKAEKRQEKAQKQQEAKERVQLAESRRQQMREERVRRAQILQRSANLGVTQSSGEAGALSNLAARTGSNMAFQTGQTNFATEISKTLQTAADYQSTANQWGRIGQMSSSAFSSAGGFKTLFDQ